MQNGKIKKEVNVKGELCKGVKEWLQQNKLLLIENDKGRATCIIENEKVNELVDKELENEERYKKLNCDDIEKVKSAVNKELACLRNKEKITIEQMKHLKQITPTTPVARATLKAHKDPRKVRLIINTQRSACHKITKFFIKN